MISSDPVNLVVLESLRAHNRRFVNEAIDAWDRAGGGCFGEFVFSYVMGSWVDMVVQN